MRREPIVYAAATSALAAALATWEPAAAQPVLLHTPTPAPYTSTVGAHARYSKARINAGSPDLALTAAVIAAGGGGATFDAQKFVADLAGDPADAQAESARLSKKFGADNVASFMRTFGYFITDGLAQATAAGIELPNAAAPDPSDGKALVAALLAAGTPPHGGFDAEYLLDALFSHVTHVAVMNDIDANPDLGPQADANFHAVLEQLMLDRKTTAGR